MHPAVRRATGGAAAGVEHVLPVEVRAVAVGRCDRVHKERLPLRIHLRRFGECRVKREETVELGTARQVWCEIAAQPGVSRVGGGSHNVEPICGAPLDDEDEPALAGGTGKRHLRQAKQREPACGTCRREKRSAREHIHLLTNSGLTSRSASPSAGLSARAIAVRDASLSESGNNFSASARASTVDAALATIRCATSTRRTSASGPAQLAATSSQPAGEPGCHVGCPSCLSTPAAIFGSRSVEPTARRAETDHSHGLLNLSALGDQGSGDSISARYTVGKLPPLDRYALLSRSTSAGGGSSPAKCRASLVDRCLAVAGLAARSRSTARACASPG